MTYQEMLHWLEGYVTSEGPVRGTQLKALAVNRWHMARKGAELCPDVDELLDKLVEDRRIIKLDYITPRTSPETKSLYFPPKTHLSIMAHYRIGA